MRLPCSQRLRLGAVGGVVAVLAALMPAQPATVTSVPVVSDAVPYRMVSAEMFAEPGDTVKYYMVREPVNGQQEYLFDIALRTLGDGRRYPEIFKLNEGRLQPDGGRLTDPMQLRPGWILLLPADAEGADVRTGPMPLPDGPPGTSAGPDSTTIDLPPDATDAEPSGWASGIVLKAAALGLIMLLLAAAVLILHGGRRRAVPDAGTVPPALTGRPALLAIASRATQALPTGSVPAASPADTAEPMAIARADISESEVSESEVSVDDVRVDDVTADVVGADMVDDVSAAPSAGTSPELVAELIGDGESLTVSLLGARESEPGSAYAWRGAQDAAPSGEVPVVLGERGDWFLYADLARAPDVVTITGPPEACRTQAVRLARQLCDAGVQAMVVGDAFGDEAPQRCARVADFPVSDLVPPPSDPPRVIFCAGLAGDEWRAARQLLVRSEGRAVVIVLGDVPRARWSLEVGTLTGWERQAG